jgi:glycosyltransferase involved in cell wall biosynthesis
VYAGLHGLFQGLDQVLRAAERLRKDRVRFILFGDGPDKDTLVKKVQGLGLDNIDFYPPVPHKQMPPILASMDVAVVPLKSRIRGAVPSKIYEAMASGIPILLVADGEAMEIVREARAGVTVNPGDIDGLVSAVRRLASQSGWRREIGEAGRLAALKRYDRLTIAKKFEAVLRKGERGLV